MKKIKYRLRSSDFTIPFCIAVLSCAVGAVVSLELFRISFSKALAKINETPIAEIIYKKKNAQRKLLNRNVWDRLRNHSEIYNGDTIHTSALSEATVCFADGNVMELSENSMVQIFVSEKNNLVTELVIGEASFNTTNGKNEIKIFSENEFITVQKESEVSAIRTESDLSLVVEKGTAVTDDGTVIASEDSLKFIKDKKFQSKLKFLSPSNNSKILFHNNDFCTVLFRWKISESKEPRILLVISEDKKFSKTIYEENVSGLNEKSVDLQKGIYYWKIIYDDVESSVMRIQTIKSPLPMLASPDSEMNYLYRKKNPRVRFIWTESPGASAYRLIIADNSHMKNPAVEQTVSSLSAVITTLTEGKWWWTVEPYYSMDGIGFVKNNKSQSFQILKKGKLSSPVLYVPADDSLIDITAPDRKVVFSWKNISDSVSYRLYISKREDLANPLYEISTEENFCNLDLNKYSLTEEKYWWSVVSVDSEGNLSSDNKVQLFHGVKGKSEQHLVEPCRGYTISKSLLRDTKFTWKKTLGDMWNTEFQVSTSIDFSKIVIKEKMSHLQLLFRL